MPAPQAYSCYPPQNPFADHFRTLAGVACLVSIPLLTSCTHIDVKQVAYEVLRQEDCRINQLDDFCSRNFAREYLEYTRLRKDYIRSQQQHVWRVSHDDWHTGAVEHTKRSSRATQKRLFKAAFARDIGHIAKNANAEEALLTNSLRASR